MGGLVSAVVTTLLIIIWLLATPNNSFNGAPAGTPLPSANDVNPLDVPTQVGPVGTTGPGSLPTFVPPVPTGSPKPSGYYLSQPVAGGYEPGSLSVVDSWDARAFCYRL